MESEKCIFKPLDHVDTILGSNQYISPYSVSPLHTYLAIHGLSILTNMFVCLFDSIKLFTVTI
jgi:hypothetical protein